MTEWALFSASNDAPQGVFNRTEEIDGGHQCLLLPRSARNTISLLQAVSRPQPPNVTSATNRVGRPTVTGGTTACVVAARLAAADATLRVLLLEAGPTTYNDPSHTEPLKYLSHIAPDSRTARFHVTQPSAALGGRTLTVPSGQCLGGGGSINCAPHVSSPLYELRPSDLALGELLAVMMYIRKNHPSS